MKKFLKVWSIVTAIAGVILFLLFDIPKAFNTIGLCGVVKDFTSSLYNDAWGAVGGFIISIAVFWIIPVIIGAVIIIAINSSKNRR